MICCGCFSEKGDANFCTSCGYDEVASRPIYLQYRTLLQDRFIVGKNLGKVGGSGVTYLAFDKVLNTKVAIKEFLPLDMATRSGGAVMVFANSEEHKEPFEAGLKKFLEEAQILAMFDHPNIVRVKDFFRANGTAYIVMSYYAGLPLDEYVKKKGGTLPEQEALSIALPLLGGLEAVHERNFYHRDIKPQNIYITSGGSPVLLDFGSARLVAGQMSHASVPFVSHGFSPYEQYQAGGGSGPVSDVYGVAATIYYMISGEQPMIALERVTDDRLKPLQQNGGASKAVSSAVVRGMAILPTDRPQTAVQFRLLLEGKIASSDIKPVSGIDHDAKTVAYTGTVPPIPDHAPAQPAASSMPAATGNNLPPVQKSFRSPAASAAPAVNKNLLEQSGKLNNGKKSSMLSAAVILVLLAALVYQFAGSGGSSSEVAPASSKPKVAKKVDVSELIASAKASLASKDYKKAAEQARAALEVDPINREAAKIEYDAEAAMQKVAELVSKAEAELNSGKLAKAKKSAEQALKLSPNNARAAAVLAMADANLQVVKQKNIKKKKIANSKAMQMSEVEAALKSDSLPVLKAAKTKLDKILSSNPNNKKADELSMAIDDKIWELELELESLESERARLKEEIAADKKQQQDYEKKIAKK